MHSLVERNIGASELFVDLENSIPMNGIWMGQCRVFVEIPIAEKYGMTITIPDDLLQVIDTTGSNLAALT